MRLVKCAMAFAHLTTKTTLASASGSFLGVIRNFADCFVPYGISGVEGESNRPRNLFASLGCGYICEWLSTRRDLPDCLR